VRRVNIENVAPCAVNGKSIYTLDSKRKLISQGMKLLPEYVKKLKALGLRYIYIDDEISEGIEIQEMIPEDMQCQTKESLYDIYRSAQSGGTINNTKELAKNINNIIDSFLVSNEIVANLTDIRITDDYTFVHSVNVSMLSIITGIKLGLNDIELHHLGIGALLHDIGKTKIPLNILNSPNKLTEEEMKVIRKHPEYGFEILKPCDTLNRNSVYVSLGHHEWYNGNGYPHGFAQSQIHKFARIVGIVDVFDAMTSDRVYRKGMEPLKVVEYLKLMSGKQFDPVIVDKFIDRVILYPSGTSVMLNTKEVGLVVKSDIYNKYKPIVRLILDPDGKRYEQLTEVDLSKNDKYSIIGIYDEL